MYFVDADEYNEYSVTSLGVNKVVITWFNYQIKSVVYDTELVDFSATLSDISSRMVHVNLHLIKMPHLLILLKTILSSYILFLL